MKWKDKERELNARAKMVSKGTLFHLSTVPTQVKDAEGNEKVIMVGNTYRKPK